MRSMEDNVKYESEISLIHCLNYVSLLISINSKL